MAASFLLTNLDATRYKNIHAPKETGAHNKRKNF
jgi:hypothetical protein